MDEIVIRDLSLKDEYFVGTCSHMYESIDYDICAERRVGFIRKNLGKGLRVKVAFFNERYAGFIHIVPIEISPFGPIGEGLMVVPCLFVQPNFRKRGIGRKLMKEAFKESIKQDRSGVVVVGYRSSISFMPVEFFKRIGFKVIKEDPENKRVLLWKLSESNAKKPDFLKPNYSFKGKEGKVIIDLFYTNFCIISLINVEKIKRVVREFFPLVILNLHLSDDREVFMKYQIPQGIFINGKMVDTFYEFSEYDLRKLIVEELKRIKK